MANIQLTAFLLAAAASLTASAQQSTTLNVPGTPDNAPTTITGCLMPGGGATSMPGSGGASGTGPAGMNADAANSGVFFVVNLGKKHRPANETSYSLVGGDSAVLERYARSPVEVKGFVQPPAAKPGPGTGVTVTSGRKKSTSPREFRIMAIKQVPGSCGGR